MASLDRQNGIDLLKSEKYSDYTIHCESHSFKCHKNIISPKSQFIAKCIDGPFKEGNESALTLPETDPYILALLLTQLYTGEIDNKVARDIWPTIEGPKADFASWKPGSSRQPVEETAQLMEV